ncbi:hypothetical protein SBBP1_360008 [Burkholderiales bacterium]|nr:hypothetical protein SBBP1_360008 [Burkholderiales bacterium]
MIDAGTQLPHDAGKTATETLGAASEGADLMQAVKHTTQQQSAAFTELSLTINGLIDASHNNFALVAELGADAAELPTRGMELFEQMGRFQHGAPGSGPAL